MMQKLMLLSLVALLLHCCYGEEERLKCWEQGFMQSHKKEKTCALGEMCASSVAHKDHLPTVSYKRCVHKDKCNVQEEHRHLGATYKVNNTCCGTNFCNVDPLQCYACDFANCATEVTKTCEPGQKCVVSKAEENKQLSQAEVKSASCLNATKCDIIEQLTVQGTVRPVHHKCCDENLCNKV